MRLAASMREDAPPRDSTFLSIISEASIDLSRTSTVPKPYPLLKEIHQREVEGA
jgi:hypothetical protein